MLKKVGREEKKGEFCCDRFVLQTEAPRNFLVEKRDVCFCRLAERQKLLTGRQMDRWTSRQEESRQKERKRAQTPGNLSSCGLVSAARV